MSIKRYDNLVSPFVPVKALFHAEPLLRMASGDVPAPVTCEVDLADGFCNHSCPHCFFGSQYKSRPTFLDRGVLRTTMFELAAAGTRAIEFVGGGEPTTHPEVAGIIEDGAEAGLDLGLITNGQLLSRVLSVASRLTYMRVSLDAATAETYQKTHGVAHFAKVVRNIRALSNSMDMERVGIGYLIVPENIGEIEEAADLAADLGARFIQFRPASLPYDVPAETWEAAREAAERAKAKYRDDEFQVFNAVTQWHHMNNERHYAKCLTTPLVSVIKASGDISLCILKRDLQETHIGNIYDGGYFNHWGGDRHRQLISEIDVVECPLPCKHDSYNIVAEGLQRGLFHHNFV